jgi:DtxR family Mn-dependent transcriptional regulator
VFLHEKLNFSWDEVHEVAEQLEHIHSEKLTLRLEEYLGFPTYDPHGDPIPSATGELKEPKRLMLSEIGIGSTCQVVGVKDSSTDFLQYLHQMDVGIGTKIKVI